MKNTKAAERYFAVPVKTVSGSTDNEITHIYERLDNLLQIRKIHIKANKEGTPIDICQVSDVHFNYVNADDFAENDPCVMSSYKNRLWLRGGASLQNAIRAFEYGGYCDQMVVTGDILDFYTHGALEYTEKYLWRPYPDAIATLGGHDVLRRMQGEVEDNMPISVKYNGLQKIWKHDILYYSRILDNRLMLIQMNNDRESYTSEQYEKLFNDINKAKQENLTVLIFQHEPICTGNPADTDVPFISIGDSASSHDFYNRFAGNERSDETTKSVYKLITENADVIKGVFCGHWHNDVYTEISASYKDEDGNRIKAVIPQHTLTANAYGCGNILHITVE